MNTTTLLDQSLEWVVDRVGDPAPLVYQRLFERSPALLPLFVLDTQGSVRGEMFQVAIESMIDLASGRPHAEGMIACEWSNHRLNGILRADFIAFFELTVEVFREALGADWTPDLDAAWQRALQAVATITAPAST